MSEKPFQIHHWRVNPDANKITGKGGTSKLDHKVMQLLVYFARNSGKDLSKAEIIREVWGEDVFSEEVLTVAVSALRKALGDDAQNPLYIKTIPRYGYRMLKSAAAGPETGGRKNLLEYLEDKVGLRFLIVSSIVILFLIVTLVMFLGDKHRHW